MKKLTKLAIFLIFSCFVFLPLLVIVLLAVGKSWNYPQLLPQQINFGSYFKLLFTNHELLTSLTASISLALGTIVLTISIAYPTAIVLAYYQFRGKKLLNILVYLPLIIPGIALLTNVDFMMIKLGLDGSFLGVISIHTLFCLPYAIKLLVDNLALLHNRYEVVSRNLGASGWQTFFQITLPLSKNGLQGAVMMTYIVSMTQYLATLLVGDGKYLTLSVRMFPFTQAGKYKIAAVYGVTFMLVTLIPLYLIDAWMSHQERRVIKS
ncbi:ABC transporter permease [Loigolactobacillus iwatensis]|uniref:ABC transporter permease n=1 Tax=Loigolactobacillus iwatensis TaxID=1267156 RepID=UPI000F7E30F4|nr:ABC transporter permease subunit [Loigolactobacillus iwatensis]